jgi:hypothetical protein
MLSAMALYWPPKAEKRIQWNLGSQFVNLAANVPTFINILTRMFLAFINNLRPSNNPKMLKISLPVRGTEITLGKVVHYPCTYFGPGQYADLKVILQLICLGVDKGYPIQC